jgi:hypothetical protein
MPSRKNGAMWIVHRLRPLQPLATVKVAATVLATLATVKVAATGLGAVTGFSPRVLSSALVAARSR